MMRSTFVIVACLMMPAAWLEERQQFQHGLGLTGIRELVLSPLHVRTYHEMHRQKRLTMRVSMGVMFGVQHVDGSENRP